MASVRWTRLALVAPFVASIVLLGVCGGDDDGGGGDVTAEQVQPLVATADITAGSQVFASNCARCHGDDGSGGQGPDLRHVADQLSVDQQIQIVLNGRNIMPVWKGRLSAEEISQVIRFTREGLTSGG